MAKIDIDTGKVAEWMGVAIDAGSTLMKGANFTLKQMLVRTASHLDVAESAIRLDFGKRHGDWVWTAKLVRNEASSSGGVRRMVDAKASADDPMSALGALAEKRKRA